MECQYLALTAYYVVTRALSIMIMGVIQTHSQRVGFEKRTLSDNIEHTTFVLRFKEKACFAILSKNILKFVN